MVEKIFEDFEDALEYARNVLIKNGFAPEKMKGSNCDLSGVHSGNFANLMGRLREKQKPTSIIPDEPINFKLARLCYSFNKIYTDNFSKIHYSVIFNNISTKGEVNGEKKLS